MFKTKRLWVALLACMLAVSMMPVSLADQPAEVETYTYTVYQPHFGTPTVDKPIWKAMVASMEKYLGVKLDFQLTEIDYSDWDTKLPAYLAAGDVADVVRVSKTYAQTFGEAGMAVNIMDYKDEYVYFADMIEKASNVGNFMAADGESAYIFPTYNYHSKSRTQCCWAVRKDTFETLGLTPPTTFDEIYEAAKAIKKAYPDVYPIGTSATDLGTILGSLLFKNKCNCDMYYDGTQFIYGPTQQSEAIREVVEWFTKCYNEGLIDPEFMSNSSELMQQKTMNGTYHIMFQIWAGYIGDFNANEYSDAVWCEIPVGKAFDGSDGWMYGANTSGWTVGSSGNMINASVTGDRLQVLLKASDFLYSNEQMMLNFGEEGVDYTLDADGTVVYIDAVRNGTIAENTKYFEQRGICYAFSASCRPGLGSRLSFVDQMDYAVESDSPVWANGEYFEYNARRFTSDYQPEDAIPPTAGAPDVTRTDDENDEYVNIITPMNTYFKEEVVKFMTGKRDMGEWDAFIEQLKNMADWQYAVDIMNGHL